MSIKRLFCFSFAVFSLLLAPLGSTYASDNINTKTTTKTATKKPVAASAAASAAKNKPSTKPIATTQKIAATKPAAVKKTSKANPQQNPAVTKKAKPKYDLAAAQGAGGILKFKPDPSKPHYKQFEDYIRTVIAPHVPGAALAVIANGQVQVLTGFGVREVGSTESVTADTVFRLASVSKTMASGSAAILVRDKQLSWDTPVTSKIKGLEFSNASYGKQLTLRDVLAQSTGLPKHTYTHLIEENLPYQTAIDRLRYVNFVCPPGRCYSYQNVVYSLSGDMIKAVSGKSYEAFTVEKLFKPLNMQTASFGLDAFESTTNKALPHVWRSGQWRRSADVDHNYYSVGPAAGANASIRDMSQWVLAQLGHKQDVLPTYLLDAMQQKITRNTLGDSHYAEHDGLKNTSYGLGWRVFDFGPHKNFAHHGGWVQGYRAEVVFNRDLQIGMVFLTNSETKLARNIIFKYLDFYENDVHKGKAGSTIAGNIN